MGRSLRFTASGPLVSVWIRLYGFYSAACDRYVWPGVRCVFNMSPMGAAGLVGERTRAQKVKILLVDDFAPIRKLMLLLLDGHTDVAEVREAEDGFAAIDLCTRFEPDLVLLDFWMPGMDGAETAARIREMYPTTAIVAYSAVLETLPPWADAMVIKEAVPDPDDLVRLARND